MSDSEDAGGGQIPLLPLRDIVVFPHMVVPLFVGRPKSIQALEDAMAGDRQLVVAAQRQAGEEDPTSEDIFDIGTLGTIIQLLRLPDGTVKVLVEGKSRAEIRNYASIDPYFAVEINVLEDDAAETPEAEALVRSIHTTFDAYSKLNKKIAPEVVNSVAAISEPGKLSDTIVAHLNLKLPDRQKLLEVVSSTERLEEVFSRMQAEIEVLEVERKIRGRVKKQMERSQKEYYLNEQMRAIQKELGDRDEQKNELDELDEQLAAKQMPEEARDRTEKEIKKLKQMSPMAAEATVVRNYIDWMLALPWDEYAEEEKDLNVSQDILDADHYGLDKPKERILEYLAVQTLVEKIKGPILCLVGPPGVGKTSLGKSIARSTGRDFVRISLGGVRDEAEIRGHRRTYIGALPGKIIQGLKKAGSSNPVFLLDEIDKMSMDFRGDPSSAMLEVLDPEQNHTFADHYLDVDYDLSHVMFICTANVLGEIPRPLQDRMEIIQIPATSRARNSRSPRPISSRRCRPTTVSRPIRWCSPKARSSRSSGTTPVSPAFVGSNASWRPSRERSPVRWFPGRGLQAGEGDAEAGPQVPRRPAASLRPHGSGGSHRRHDGPRLHGGRWRTPSDGGRRHARQGQTPDHGPTRRSHAGVGERGVVLYPLARQAARTDERFPHQDRHPHPRSGRRHAERRSLCGHHAGDHDRFGADAHSRAFERGHDG